MSGRNGAFFPRISKRPCWAREQKLKPNSGKGFTGMEKGERMSERACGGLWRSFLRKGTRGTTEREQFIEVGGQVMLDTETSEFITAVSTVFLAIATFLLLWATILLARTAKEDGTRKREQDTVAAWGELRRTLIGGFPHLHAQSTATPDQLDFLRRLEYFAACINLGVYDCAILVKLSRSWFLGQYERLRSYVENRHDKMVYAEVKALYEKISKTPHTSNRSLDEEDPNRGSAAGQNSLGMTHPATGSTSARRETC